MSGADAIEARPGFTAMLARIAGNGVGTIIVETANRFARDLMVQEVGFAMLKGLGITLIAADSPASFLDDGPTSLARYLRAGNGWRPYSLREVAFELAGYGYVTPSGKHYSASAVASLLAE